LGHKAPPNGIAIFCGNVSETEGKSDIQLFTVIAPSPLTTSFYRCESTFQIEPLVEMLEQTGSYGLVVMDGKEATVAILKGKSYKIIRRLTSTAHQKVNKGGQCLHEDTFVQKADGSIIAIKELKEGEPILSLDLKGYDTHVAECSAIYSRPSNKAFELSFEYPQTSIKATPEHLFFVLTENGFQEKAVEELKAGDYVPLVLKSCIEGKNVELPKPPSVEVMTEDAGRILRETRLANGLKQKEIALKLGWRQADVSALERNINKTSEKLSPLSHAYGFSAGQMALLSVQAAYFSIPESLNFELAQFIGYILGDGTFDHNRITLFDADEDLTKTYQKLALDLFGIEGVNRHREDKGYYELRLHNKWLVEYMDKTFEGLRAKTKIPLLVQQSQNQVVAGFLRGLFDAEATVSSERISLAMANRPVVLQASFLLTRFGILCSTYNKRTAYSPQFGLDITDKRSLILFRQFIGFSSRKKSQKLEAVISLKSDTSKSLTVPANGRSILLAARTFGMNTKSFRSCPGFISGRKTIGFAAFEKTVLKAIEKRFEVLSSAHPHNDIRKFRRLLGVRLEEVGAAIGISRGSVFNLESGKTKNAFLQEEANRFLFGELGRQSSACRKLLDWCSRLANSEITFCTLKEKLAYTPRPEERFYDLTIPNSEKFVAGRLAVHNSAARYQRIHEEVVEVYYKRIGEAMDGFLDIKNFKGIVVGGPGPAKEDFMKLKPYNYQLKVLGVVDTGYTDEFGLHELLEKSGDIIAEQEAIKEKKILNDFMKDISTDGLATYGYDEIKNALSKNQIAKLLVSEGFELHLLKIRCDQCGNEEEKITELKKVHFDSELICSKCAAKGKLIEEKDILTELEDLAAVKGVEIEMISQDTAEGEQFFGTFHGLGAFLRYK
jgi:peptide subunit release factor 1 (eRF1)/DNA-binding XRE family transcriptional regulator